MNTDFDSDLDLGLPGSGYPTIDRTRDRKKKGDFWVGLGAMSSGRGLMVDWEWAFGSAVDAILPFLHRTGEQATSFPCPADSPCGCRHSIGELLKTGLVATCGCDGEWECETFRIEASDLLLHALELRPFGDAIRKALGFTALSGSVYASPGLQEIGTYSAVAAPVYLSLASADALLREIRKLVALREGPFLVLTPTGNSWSPEVEALARPHAGGHVSLSSVLDVSAAGFTSKGTVEPMLAEFARRVASLRDSGGTLRNIHREIVEVRKDFGELRSAKQRLEKMLADGMFAFTRKVDAASFKVVCAVLAEGDVAKASRTLAMPDGSVRTLMRRWRGMGKEYRAMLELVRWRKAVGRKETVALNEKVLLGKAESVDYPGLVADVVEGLIEMTKENWQDKAEQLEEMLRPFVHA